MLCPKCGKSNPDNAHFCTQCGNDLTSTDASPIVESVLDTIDSAPMSTARNNLAIPAGVAGWSWGAFVFGWFWAVCNKTWIGLLALVPGIGFIMHMVLGFKGREWAWQNDHWDSVEHFQKVQRRWSILAIALILFIIVFLYAMVYFLGSTLEHPFPTSSGVKV